jgi:hypothetical protein
MSLRLFFDCGGSIAVFGTLTREDRHAETLRRVPLLDFFVRFFGRGVVRGWVVRVVNHSFIWIAQSGFFFVLWMVLKTHDSSYLSGHSLFSVFLLGMPSLETTCTNSQDREWMRSRLVVTFEPWIEGNE